MPFWVGYIEFDDETGEAIAADYNGLELYTLPDGLKFNYRTFRGNWDSDLSGLSDGSNMFNGCSNLTSFNSDLSSLSNGSNMFAGCKLDASSVERILTTIPTYTDGTTRNLHLRVSQDGAEKFKEITGNTVTATSKTVNYKGWTISISYIN